MRLALGYQCFNGNTEPFRGDLAVLEHFDFQRRVISHESVDFNEMRRFRMRDVKRGLYRLTPGIGKTPVKSDMKNILEGQMERLNSREITKAIERESGHGFSSEQLHQDFVYSCFIKNAARPPDKEV